MMITDDQELQRVVTRVNADLQAIQNYLGQDNHANAKVRFPRGYIRTAAHFRECLNFLNDKTLVRNISYALILSDVYRWILNRTDIAGTAKEMIIKEGICLIGALCESITKDALSGTVGKNRGYKARTQYLAEKNIIDNVLQADLDWVWDTRNNEHLFLVEIREHEHYKLSDYNRAVKTLRSLRKKFQAHFNVRSI